MFLLVIYFFQVVEIFVFFTPNSYHCALLRVIAPRVFPESIFAKSFLTRSISTCVASHNFDLIFPVIG